MITAFLTGFIGSMGLSIIFNIRRKHILFSALGAGLATMIQMGLTPWLGNVYMPVFVASLFAGTYSEIFASWQKAPATTYVIPAILPMVPGAGMYYTMLYFTERNFSQAAYYGYQTVFIALSIACGIVIAPSIKRMYRQRNIKST